MRSILFVILALVVAGGGFVAYWKLQAPVARVSGDAPLAPQNLFPNVPTVNNTGPGEKPWMKTIDREGRLASRFHADEYVPRDDGTVHVKGVVAEFFQYLHGHDPQGTDTHVQRIRMEGKEGDIEVQDEEKSKTASMFDKSSTSPPRRGRLNDVTLRLFPDDGSPDPRKRAETITLTTENLAFDNEAFEVFTASIRDRDGNVLVPADEVPIHVKGDYDFEGRGLKLRWNDVDGRLEFLEVAHGDFLQINHPDKLSTSTPADAARAGATTSAASAGRPAGWPLLGAEVLTDPRGAPLMLAARDKQSVGAAAGPAVKRGAKGQAAPGARPAAPRAQAESVKPHHGPQPPYRATFNDDVRISQGIRGVSERELATSDLMLVDFQPAGGPTTAPSTQPTTRSSGRPSKPSHAVAAASTTAPAGATTAPALALVDAHGGASAPSTQPTTSPTTQPSPDQQPVIVRWSGILRVLPIDATPGEMPVALQSGDAILRLIGTKGPVLLNRDQDRVRCASMDYLTSDGSALLRSSPQFPQVVLTQIAVPAAPGQPPTGQDATVTSESIDYTGSTGVAVLRGQSHAHILMRSAGPTTGPARAPEVMDARWKNQAHLYFARSASNRSESDARTDHPKTGSSPQDGLQIQRAVLEGDVDVKHPQLALKSQALDMTFEPPAQNTGTPTTNPAAGELAKQDKQPSLKHVTATDHVWCELKDQAGKQQNVTCQTLTMDTATSDDGKIYPHIVNVDGNAHAYDATQDIKAGHIELTLVPAVKPAATTQPSTGTVAVASARSTTQPSNVAPAGDVDMSAVELQAMTARDKVRAVATDGSVVMAQEMYVTMQDRQAHVRLVGAPAATVVDAKQNTIVGPVITIDPHDDLARVEGPGSLHMIRQDNPQDRPRPIDVTWAVGANVNGPQNYVDIFGPVNVVSPDPDGTVNTSTARHVRIELANKPPTTRPADAVRAAAQQRAAAGSATVAEASRATTHPAGGVAKADRHNAGNGQSASSNPLGDGMKMDFMKDKDVRAVVLDQDATVQSTLKGPSNEILRQFELKSSLIRYEIPEGSASPLAAAGAPGTKAPPKGKLIVPQPGQMLVRDHRPPVKDAQASAQDATDSNNRGATAFQWSRSLTYDEAVQQAHFAGDVVIVHQGDEPNAIPARLNADLVDAFFEPKPAAAKAHAPPAPSAPGASTAASSPTTRPADASAPVDLKWLTATGHLLLSRATARMSGQRLDFDPSSNWMIVTGDGRTPANFHDTQGANTLTADKLLWNTQTWNVKTGNMMTRGQSTEKAPPPKRPGK